MSLSVFESKQMVEEKVLVHGNLINITRLTFEEQPMNLFLMVKMFVRFWGTRMCNRPYGNILNQMRRNLYQRWVSFQHPPTTKEKLFIFLNQVSTV